MKKVAFIALFVFRVGFIFADETLWVRYYSDMTEEECNGIITKTIFTCLLQDKESVYVKKTDMETKKPYLQLKQDNKGDYWFTVASPIFTSVYFIGREDNKPTDNNYMTFDEYLKIMLDPKYVGYDRSRYFKKSLQR